MDEMLSVQHCQKMPVLLLSGFLLPGGGNGSLQDASDMVILKRKLLTRFVVKIVGLHQDCQEQPLLQVSYSF